MGIVQNITSTSNSAQHTVVLWFLAALVLIALAGPFPSGVTMVLIIIAVLVLLKNYPTYVQYLSPSVQSSQGAQNG